MGTHRTATRIVVLVVGLKTPVSMRDQICRRGVGSTLASPSLLWARRPSAGRRIGYSRVVALLAAVASITVQVPLAINNKMEVGMVGGVEYRAVGKVRARQVPPMLRR